MEQARQELVQMNCQGMERETRTCLWVMVRMRKVKVKVKVRKDEERRWLMETMGG